MCKQFIGIAQCAPEDPAKGPLTFFCGQLHQYAAHRDTCDAAKGDCICFFGTCGIIETVVRSQPFDLMSLPKMRCLLCTTREEQVGERRHGRDFLETKLLTRRPVAEEAMVEHATMLKNCWNGASVCPFHDLEPSEPSKPASIDGAAHGADGDHVVETVQTAAIEEAEAVKSLSNENFECNDQPQETEVQNTVDANQVEKDTASVADTPTQPFEQENNEPTFDRESFEVSDKNNMDSNKVKPALGIETSRWAPGGASRTDTKPESVKGLDKTEEPLSTPRRDLYDTPTVEKGTTRYAGMAVGMRAFLGLD